MIGRLLDLVADLPEPLLYLVAALLAFGETAIGLDLVVPGEAGMVIVGASGERAGVPLVGLVAAAAVGATSGDLVSYWIGRRFGLRVLDRWSFSRRLLPKAKRAEAYFERGGGPAVFAGRWVGALRAVVPLVAGTARMPFTRFVAWNVAASVTWTATVVTLGYVAGSEVASAVDRAGGWLSVAVVALVVAWLLWRRRARRAAP